LIQVEKAMLEGKPISPFEKLLVSASAILTGLQNKENELIKRESQLSSTNEEIEELPPEGSPQRRKINDLIEKSNKYLFRTVNWGCVTVVKKRQAVTFAHDEHETLKPGMSMKIYSIEENVEYDVEVLETNLENDWVLLESQVDLCEDYPKIGVTADGRVYTQLDLSATNKLESPLSTSKGVISSSLINKFGLQLGSSGASPGDSGGPCFDESNGQLIGINVGCEDISISIENDTGAQIFEKIAFRYASRAHIIPVNSFQWYK
jgi:hypothetical protein